MYQRTIISFVYSSFITILMGIYHFWIVIWEIILKTLLFISSFLFWTFFYDFEVQKAFDYKDFVGLFNSFPSFFRRLILVCKSYMIISLLICELNIFKTSLKLYLFGKRCLNEDEGLSKLSLSFWR